MLDDVICDARAWILFTLVLLALVTALLTTVLFVGLLIQFAVREIRRKALEVLQERRERTETSWQPKT